MNRFARKRHPLTEQVKAAILTTREVLPNIAKRIGVSYQTVLRCRRDLEAQGQRIPRRYLVCRACGEVPVRKPGRSHCTECHRRNGRMRFGKADCKTEGCDRIASVHGMCRRHYHHEKYLSTPAKRALHSRRVIENRRKREAQNGG